MQIISACRQIIPKLHITQFVSNSVILYSYQRAVFCLTQLTQLSLTLCDPMDYNPPGPSAHRDSSAKNTGVDCHALLQGIFPTQGSNHCLLCCRWILYRLSHQGSPWILESVAYPFSRGNSWLRNWTGVSCIAGRFFTSWAIREAHSYQYSVLKWSLTQSWHLNGSFIS